MPAPEWLELRWQGHPICRITDVGWSDYPWAGGSLGPGEWSAELLQSLEWYYRSEDDDEERTFEFPPGVFDGWTLIDPSGDVVQISPPKVDITQGYIEWR